jgi:hypothetical protein
MDKTDSQSRSIVSVALTRTRWVEIPQDKQWVRLLWVSFLLLRPTPIVAKSLQNLCALLWSGIIRGMVIWHLLRHDLSRCKLISERKRLRIRNVKSDVWWYMIPRALRVLVPLLQANGVNTDYEDASSGNLSQYTLGRFFQPAEEQRRIKRVSKVCFTHIDYTFIRQEPVAPRIHVLPTRTLFLQSSTTPGLDGDFVAC